MDNILNTTLKEIDDQQLRSINESKYGYLYITMNMINHKKYIGAHKCSNKEKVLDKWYKGSGKYLRRAIEKYGWTNFRTRILKWFDSEEELFKAEYDLIEKYNCVSSKEFYNIHPGGKGGRTWANYENEEDIIAVKKLLSDCKKNRHRTEKESKQLDDLHKGNIGRHRTEDSKRRSRKSNLGQTRSQETKDKLKLRRSYPRITYGNSYKYVNPEEIPSLLENGHLFYSEKDKQKYYRLISG